MQVNTPVDFKAYIDKAIDYPAYLSAFEKLVEANTNLSLDEQVPYFQYYPLNLQRTHRLHKQYVVTDELQAAINALDKPLHWLVITEPWCGDSAQNLPVIARLAEASMGKIKLHIVYRDANLELMDQFLTNGGRSIPKLLQLNENLDLISQWGPRPAAAQQLLLTLKSQNIPHDEYITIVHKWYTDDKAQSLNNELVELINEGKQ